MADMRSAKDGKLWRDLRRQFPRIYKLKLDMKETLHLVDLVYQMRNSTPQIFREQQLKNVVNEYLDTLEFMRNIGRR